MRFIPLKKSSLLKLILCGASVCTILACGLPSRPPIETSSWLVSPTRTGPARQPRTDIWLRMGAVSVTTPFDGKSLVYRLGDNRYEKDFYNVYAALPNEMVSNATRQWMNQANIFSMTVGQGTSFFPFYTLQASVEEFYGDYRVRPEAVVTVEFFLTVTTAGIEKPLIGSNRYTKRVTLANNTPAALVQGEQEALAEILKLYEVQLNQYAAKLPKPIGQ